MDARNGKPLKMALQEPFIEIGASRRRKETFLRHKGLALCVAIAISVQLGSFEASAAHGSDEAAAKCLAAKLSAGPMHAFRDYLDKEWTNFSPEARARLVDLMRDRIFPDPEFQDLPEIYLASSGSLRRRG